MVYRPFVVSCSEGPERRRPRFGWLSGVCDQAELTPLIVPQGDSVVPSSDSAAQKEAQGMVVQVVEAPAGPAHILVEQVHRLGGSVRQPVVW